MVKIPHIRIPSVRVGSIDPTSDIGTGGATPAPPTPITYLTQWKIVGNSEVKTLPYPDGVILPTGYKRCEYLTFDGSSYIDTNTTTDANTIVKTAASTATTTRWLLGSRTSDTAGKTNVCFGMYGHGGVSDKILLGHGGQNNQVFTGFNLLDNTKHLIIIENGKLTFDNVEYSLSTLDEYTSNTILIGALKLQDGTPHSNMWNGNIYDTIIYNTQGELWHGIPCLDANDVPCFYDIVSQTAFYNQGSGSFTYKLYPQPTEIWSCGEYSAVDGKWHIRILPEGKSPVDIALDEPLRKVNDIADTIEFPSETEGKALVTRYFVNYQIKDFEYSQRSDTTNCHRIRTLNTLDIINYDSTVLSNTLTVNFINKTLNDANNASEGYYVSSYNQYLMFYVPKSISQSDFEITYGEDEILVEPATPTTELVDAPQIEEADSYTCVISQGAKAVSWSSFETDSE